MEYIVENNEQYWREVFSLHADLYSFKKKVEEAKNVIDKFLQMGLKVYGSVSGGKDSTAMLHLINSVNSDITFMTEKDDMDFPNEREYIDTLVQKYNLEMDIISPSISLWEEVKNIEFTEDIHSRGTSFSDRNFYGIIEQYKKIKGFEGVFLGLRTQESKGRKANFQKNGFIYHNKTSNDFICQPIANFTATDVFAYLVSNDIPILDVYFKTKFVGTPLKIRKSWVLPSAQSSSGQALWLKYYYPEIFTKLCEINPLMRAYV